MSANISEFKLARRSKSALEYPSRSRVPPSGDRQSILSAALSTLRVPNLTEEKNAVPTPEDYMQKALRELKLKIDKLGFMPPVIPPRENERLEALRRFEVLDSPDEPSYDNLVSLAAEACGVSIASVTLLESDKCWYKSRIGLKDAQTSRDIAFCGHAINTPEQLMIVEDTSQDERFSGNPMVIHGPHVRFYAGQPLVTRDGYALGTLCVMDTKPRKLNEHQKNTLFRLSKQVITDMELRITLKHLRQQTDVMNKLLLNVLPAKIIERLKQNPNASIADSHDDVSVLFADIVGFTTYCTKHSPQTVIEDLDHVFSVFDKLCEKYGVEKIKTIGDGYMVSCGVPEAVPNHAILLVSMGMDMITSLESFNRQFGKSFQLRIGINSGPVYAGVIGSVRFSYDLWGHTVNMAARVESSGVVGQVCVSESTFNIVKMKWPAITVRTLLLKGMSNLERVYTLGPKPDQFPDSAAGRNSPDVVSSPELIAAHSPSQIDESSQTSPISWFMSPANSPAMSPRAPGMPPSKGPAHLMNTINSIATNSSTPSTTNHNNNNNIKNINNTNPTNAFSTNPILNSGKPMLPSMVKAQQQTKTRSGSFSVRPIPNLVKQEVSAPTVVAPNTTTTLPNGATLEKIAPFQPKLLTKSHNDGHVSPPLITTTQTTTTTTPTSTHSTKQTNEETTTLPPTTQTTTTTLPPTTQTTTPTLLTPTETQPTISTTETQPTISTTPEQTKPLKSALRNGNKTSQQQQQKSLPNQKSPIPSLYIRKSPNYVIPPKKSNTVKISTPPRQKLNKSPSFSSSTKVGRTSGEIANNNQTTKPARTSMEITNNNNNQTRKAARTSMEISNNNHNQQTTKPARTSMEISNNIKSKKPGRTSMEMSNKPNRSSTELAKSASNSSIESINSTNSKSTST